MIYLLRSSLSEGQETLLPVPGVVRLLLSGAERPPGEVQPLLQEAPELPEEEPRLLPEEEPLQEEEDQAPGVQDQVPGKDTVHLRHFIDQ